MTTSNFLMKPANDTPLSATGTHQISQVNGLRYVLIASTFAIGTVIGTSASASAQVISHNVLRTPTDAGTMTVKNRVALKPRDGANSMLREIRKLTGFTWHQLAALLDVDRRSLHLWVTGGGIRPEHERMLIDLRDITREYNAGNPADTRAEMMSGEFRSQLVRDLLTRARIDVGAGKAPIPDQAARALENDFNLERITTRTRVARAHRAGQLTRIEPRPTGKA